MKEELIESGEKSGYKSFLERADATYTNPGRRDTVMSKWITVNVNTSKKDTFCMKFVIYLVLLPRKRL